MIEVDKVLEPDFKLGLCAICNKRPATHFCDYIMEYHNNMFFIRDRKTFNEVNRRGAQYETCDLPMCKDCSTEISKDHDLCTHHYGLYMQRELTNPYQRTRQSQAKGYIARSELQ